MNSTGLSEFFKYGDIECSFMRVRGKSDKCLEDHPYHLNVEDLESYISGDPGGDELVEIYRFDRALYEERRERERKLSAYHRKQEAIAAERAKARKRYDEIEKAKAKKERQRRIDVEAARDWAKSLHQYALDKVNFVADKMNSELGLSYNNCLVIMHEEAIKKSLIAADS